MKYSLLKRDRETLTEEEKDLYYEQLRAWTQELEDHIERLERGMRESAELWAKYGL